MATIDRSVSRIIVCVWVKTNFDLIGISLIYSPRKLKVVQLFCDFLVSFSREKVEYSKKDSMVPYLILLQEIGPRKIILE